MIKYFIENESGEWLTDPELWFEGQPAFTKDPFKAWMFNDFFVTKEKLLLGKTGFVIIDFRGPVGKVLDFLKGVGVNLKETSQTFNEGWNQMGTVGYEHLGTHLFMYKDSLKTEGINL